MTITIKMWVQRIEQEAEFLDLRSNGEAFSQIARNVRATVHLQGNGNDARIVFATKDLPRVGEAMNVTFSPID